jgi:hypothetical protein
LAIALALTSCRASSTTHPKERTRAEDSVVSHENLGRRVTLVGRAINTKLGAVLMGRDFAVYIDGLQSWPEGYYRGRGRRLRVSGILVSGQLPVFVRVPGEPEMQGIPVAPGEDTPARRHRYVLRNATWGRAR